MAGIAGVAVFFGSVWRTRSIVQRTDDERLEDLRLGVPEPAEHVEHEGVVETEAERCVSHTPTIAKPRHSENPPLGGFTDQEANAKPEEVNGLAAALTRAGGQAVGYA